MLQSEPYLTPDQVKCKLLDSARPATKADGYLWSDSLTETTSINVWVEEQTPPASAPVDDGTSGTDGSGSGSPSKGGKGSK